MNQTTRSRRGSHTPGVAALFVFLSVLAFMIAAIVGLPAYEEFHARSQNSLVGPPGSYWSLNVKRIMGYRSFRLELVSPAGAPVVAVASVDREQGLRDIIGEGDDDDRLVWLSGRAREAMDAASELSVSGTLTYTDMGEMFQQSASAALLLTALTLFSLAMKREIERSRYGAELNRWLDGKCPKCKYPIDSGSTTGGTCPECGLEIARYVSEVKERIAFKGDSPASHRAH